MNPFVHLAAGDQQIDQNRKLIAAGEPPEDATATLSKSDGLPFTEYLSSEPRRLTLAFI
jgi:hypothetical protein